MKCIPENVLFSICTWCLEWKTCNLASVSSNATAPSIYYTESCRIIWDKKKVIINIILLSKILLILCTYLNLILKCLAFIVAQQDDNFSVISTSRPCLSNQNPSSATVNCSLILKYEDEIFIIFCQCLHILK